MLKEACCTEMNQVYASYEYHPEFLGIDLDSPYVKGAIGNSLLHLASFRGDIKSCSVLVSHGVDVNIRGDLENTPLHDAVLGNNMDVIEFLLEHGARRDLRNRFGQTPKEVAEIGAKKNALKVL